MSKMLEVDDVSYDVWMRGITNHPILGVEYRSMLDVYQRLMQPPRRRMPEEVRFGEIYQQVYGPSVNSALVLDRLFRRSAARLRTEDRQLIRVYALPMTGRLRGESTVQHTHNPSRLVQIALGSNGSDLLAQHRRIEALPRYIMSRLLVEIDETESEVDVGGQFEDVLDALLGRLFVAGQSNTLHLYSLHDPSEEMIAHEVQYSLEREIQPRERDGMIWIHEELVCRFMEDPSGNLIPAVIDDRVKDDFSSALKIVRKGNKLSEEVDKLALTIFAMTPGHFQLLDRKLGATVSQSPFSVKEREDLYEASGEKRSNPASSGRFLVVRYILYYTDDKRGVTVPVEVNLQLARDHANVVHSRTDARHARYRLDQLCRSYFPFRFPRFVFNVDFRSGSADYNEMLAALR